jgi:hypothetical protein
VLLLLPLWLPLALQPAVVRDDDEELEWKLKKKLFGITGVIS